MPTKDELETLLKDALSKIKEYEAFVKKVQEPPLIYGSIARVHSESKTVLAMVGNQYCEIPYPTDFDGHPHVGQIIKLSMESKVPVDIVSDTLPGQIMLVTRRISDELVELDSGGGQAVGQPSTVAFCSFMVEPGDRLVMDQGRQVAIVNLGPDPALKKQNVIETFTPVYWDDIGGLEDVKAFFYEIFERPHLSPKIYRAYGLPLPKGALLSGPPGCGKTLIAKAVMTDLAERHGAKNIEGGFLSVKGPELLSMWVGKTEERIRELFGRARKFQQENGFPAVIFIDEAEAIMNKRGSGKSSDVDRTIVPAFLAEMDGVESSGAIVLLATNRPEMLDPAVIREGRIDRKVRVPRPNFKAATRILEINLQRYPLSQHHTLQEFVASAADYLFREEHRLYTIHLGKQESRVFKFSDILSGAICAAIVQSAASQALSRDIENQSVGGIQMADLTSAIDNLVSQHRHLDYTNEVDEFTTSFKDDVTSIERVLA